jgi:hypothetical protein
MKWGSDFYTGAIEAYERETLKAEKAGISISFTRLEQFKMTLEDFKELEEKVRETQSTGKRD